MNDVGIVCKGEIQGKEVLGLRVSWNKRYITLAPIATLLGLAFKARDPDGLLGKESRSRNHLRPDSDRYARRANWQPAHACWRSFS